MKLEPVNIFKDGEYSHPMTFGFQPDIVPYIHEDNTVRPCVIVVPGGGYAMVSPTEGELVADRFYKAGYQTFVFSYTTNLLSAAPLMDLPMRELTRAIRIVRSRAGEFKVDPKRVVVCGFSAGSHLCGSVCVHHDDVTDPDEVLSAISPRPDAAILSYPVITSGEYAHQGSFQNLLGKDIFERTDFEAARLLDYYSIEKHVTDKTPPIFLWQTITDELVPVENSLLMARALKEHNVPLALHLFSEGRHGLSLSDDRWCNHQYGDEHCGRQLTHLQNAARSGALSLPEPIKDGLLNLFTQAETEPEKSSHEVRVWPELALEWLEKTLGH